tara:strand:- start:3345 stop:3689 length:345 start_codon:yes stop_codon:yes gene_type:complete
MKDLEEKLKQWINIDNIIEEKNNEIKELRKAKTGINNELFTIIENNNLQNSTFRINNNNIRYTSCKQTSPITLKYLENCLNNLFDDENQVEKIMNYIKENRQIKIINDIKNNKK